MKKFQAAKNIATLLDVISFGEEKETIIVLQHAGEIDLMDYLLKLAKEKTDFGARNHRSFMFDIFKQIVRGLHELHRRRVAHGDLKPDNIVLSFSNEGNVVVTIVDLGFAKKGDDEYTTTDGSPGYLSPEQIELLDKRHTRRSYLPQKSDLYSLGVVLYAMLFGEIPSGNGDVPQDGDVLHGVLLNLLDSDPDQRMTTLDLLILLNQLN